MASSGPTVAQRRLARALRRLRADAGLTIDQVAEKFDLSASTISRLETARASVRRGDIRELLDIYEVTGIQRDELLHLAGESRRQPWWTAYRDLPSAHVAGLEAEAESIRQYSAQLIPGLLQTEAYARAVLLALLGDSRPGDIERYLQLRMNRQALLTEQNSPQYLIVLDEAALRRVVGGRRVMHAQLERLIEANALPGVTLRVLPLIAGAHAGMDGAFTVYSYRKAEDHDVIDEDPDVVYVENIDGGAYIEEPNLTKRYNRTFERLLNAALEPGESIEVLTDAVHQLR